MKKSIKKRIILFNISPFIICLGFFLISITKVSCQVNQFDSIKEVFKSTPKLLIKLDSKFSFVSNQLVTMRGVKVGANYNNFVKVGLGYSWMKNNFTFDNPTDQINDSTYDLKYSYFSLFLDYNLYSKKKLTVLFNSDIALLKLGYKNKINSSIDFTSYGFVFEPSFIAEYRVLNYFILGSGFGYRFILREKNQINERFTAPIFVLRFKIDFPLIYAKYIKKNK